MTDLSDDSDCFESADEEISDESIVKNNNIKFETLGKDSCQPEIPFSISGDVSSKNGSKEAQEETELTASSLQYRKRPERRKSASRPMQALTPNSKKTGLNEHIFRTDIKKPDALFQDITSNLSKNLNKGFNTLQQTSNSIKDLVISSLPVTNLTENYGRFSYDDEEEEIISQTLDSDDEINTENEKHDVKQSLLPGKNGNKNKDTIACEELDISQVKPMDKKIGEAFNSNVDIKSSAMETSASPGSLQIEGSCDISCEVPQNVGEIKKKQVILAETQHLVHNIKQSSLNRQTREAEEEIVDKERSVKESHIYRKESLNEFIGENLTEEYHSEIDFDCKDGWDSSEVELEGIYGDEESATNDITFTSKSEVKQEVKPEIDNKVELQDNETTENNGGWDDFDIDDEELEIGEDKNERIKNTERYKIECKNSETDRSSVNQALEQLKQDENKTFGSEMKWSGWDNFGVKQEESQTSGWKLGSWGVSALLNTATSVTQGLTNVIEAGLGVPDPETLARMEHQVADNNIDDIPENLNEHQDENSQASKAADNTDSGLNLFPSFGITNLVVGVTKNIVENTKVQEIGTKVLVGGLDTLESFGKKTMEVLQDGDPGLKKKRALLLGSNKPILSQVLREAKCKAEIEDRRMEEKQIAKLCHFETLFDDFQGLIHLEALEMLSKQCELKLEQMRSSLSGSDLDDFIEILKEVKELCSIDEDEFNANYLRIVDFKISLTEGTKPLKNEISIKNIVQIYDDLDAWLKNDENTKKPPRSLFQKAMSTMAELTAATVAQFHKGGELLSVKEHRKTVEEADTLLQITGLLCCEISNISQTFLMLLTHCTSESKNEMSFKIREEANNATIYIKDAFNLLIPVLQLGAAT